MGPHRPSRGPPRQRRGNQSPGEHDYTALHEAVSQGKVEMVRWLLAHGADPHLTTELGTTWELASSSENSAAVLAVLRDFATPREDL